MNIIKLLFDKKEDLCMKSVKKGDIIHVSVGQKVKDINTCKTITIPMESEIQIIKKEKIQTGYMFTASYKDHIVEIPSGKCFSPSEWEKHSKLMAELKLHMN